ncbi:MULTISPECIES: outer membrane beta-barrel protein [Cellulophaga]|jgi:opacity protein-like surface antigen|uniref:Outer membrane protein beta-barrel domain-containing protein n=1 Tax=Cellulophaga baltica 18 TaxID=1348584 RepID=A0AAU8RCM3_9FLAO|nr:MULTISPECIES: outer membrane beta-barrel protein [Cellulophaga]AIZ41107.1 hypothetical protein M666_05715 [Cellulophaga baltica 18]KGK32261.1 hypothetical protein EL45_03000 [Cellulophaga sp. E6(2014)]WFO14901.1 porin family protein [Cellulophaga baltica 4]
MKQKLLLLISFALVSISLTAQDDSDQKFSVEASYPTSLNDGFLSNGILDIGLKYRFLDLQIVKIGVGINGSLFTENDEDNAFGSPSKTKNYFIQPKIFGEVSIPGLEKLRPSVGLGYSFVNTKIEGTSSNFGDFDYDVDNKGFNFVLGTSYDITKSFFAQIQYDVIFLEDAKEYKINEFSTLKLGVGFRF